MVADLQKIFADDHAVFTSVEFQSDLKRIIELFHAIATNGSFTLGDTKNTFLCDVAIQAVNYASFEISEESPGGAACKKTLRGQLALQMRFEGITKKRRRAPRSAGVT